MTTTTMRRVVTVLFADLVGFTSIAERLDPEDLATIQDAYFTRARAAVEDHLGQVEKFIGDAVVGSFGVDHARADDAARAAGAALAIVSVVDEVGRELGLDADVLRVRVGLNTGEMLVTTDADGSWRMTGDAVNVAARLQAAADPGDVLAGPDTALCIEPTYVVEPAGELELKGKSEAIRAWRVVEPRSAPSRAVALRSLEGRIVGRDDELRQLDAMLGGDPAARAWLVVSPPGMGRTRLVSEVMARAEAAGHPVWAARPIERRRSGYEPVADILRGALGVTEAVAPDRNPIVERMAGHGRRGTRAELAVDHTLALLAGEPLDVPPADLFDSWSAVLDAHAGARRALWVIDDVHFASPDVLAFLRHALGRRHADRAILLSASPVFLAQLESDPLPAVRVLYLEPLSADAMRRLIESMLDPSLLPLALLDDLVTASKGNPLFVEELVRVWLQTDVLTRSPIEGWSFGPAERDLHLPTTVQAIYQSELDELDVGPRRVLTVGSVPGMSFPVAVLPAFGVDGCERPLAQLTGAGLLTGPHGGVADLPAYTYPHALMRDVAYRTLTRSQRAGLHLRFAAWIEEMAPGEGVDALIGTHLAAAHANGPAFGRFDDGRSKDELARDASERLERAAIRRLASEPEWAGELLALALELTPALDGADHRRRQLQLGEALRRSGRMPEAMHALTAAAGDDGVDLETLTSAALGYEDALFASRLPRDQWGEAGIELLERALSAVEASGAADSRRACLLAALGRARAYRGDDGRPWCDAGVALARAGDDDAALAYALLALRATQTEPSDLDARLQAIAEVVEAARRAGDAETELEGLRLQYVDLLEAGAIDRADAICAQAGELATALRQPQYLWYPAMWAAMRALLTGDLDAAVDCVERFRDQGLRWHYQDASLVHAVHAMHLSIEQGRPELGVPPIEAHYRENPGRWSSVMAFAYAQAGRLDEASLRFDELAADDFAGLARDLSRLYNVALLTECAAVLGAGDAASTLVQLLEPWIGHAVVLGSGAVCLGAAAHFAGVAHAAAGDVETASSLLEQAVAENRAMGAGPALARSERALRVLTEGRRRAGA